MDYTNTIIKAATIIFGEGITKRATIYTDKVDDMEFEVEYFLDEQCRACGNIDEVLPYMVEMIEDEVERRLNYFTWDNKEAYEYLKHHIEEDVLDVVSPYKPDSLYACFGDVFPCKIFRIEVEDEDGIGLDYYFIVDLDDADFDYESFIDECYADDGFDLMTTAFKKYKKEQNNE